MTFYQGIAAGCSAAAALFFLVRARLLCSAVSGWPHAPFLVRTALMLAALALGGRSLQILLRDQEVDPSEVGIYVIVSVYAVVMGVNLVLQRTGWLLDWRPHANGAGNHNGHNGRGAEPARREAAAEPPSFLQH